jgi:hypothetical protein
MVDTDGRGLVLEPQPANVQDRDGAPFVLRLSRRSCCWVVERFFAWISRNRRLWRDPEATIASAKAFLNAASVMILTRRIARSP